MIKDRADVINIVLFLMLLGSIVANIKQAVDYRAAERFEWQSGVMSHPGNTVQVASCQFYNGKYWNYEIDKERVLDDGWKDVNYTESYKEKSLYPDTLDVCWFSYTEKKFYEGKFALPYKLLLKYAGIMRQHNPIHDSSSFVISPGRTDVMMYFVAELLQGGKVNIWITDYEKRQKIVSYQARETVKNWDVFNGPGEAAMPPTDVPARVALVMEQHKCSFLYDLPGKEQLLYCSMEFYNEDNFDSKDYEELYFPDFYNIPKSFRVGWGDSSMNYWMEYYLTDTTTLAAYHTLAKLPGVDTMNLLFRVSDSNKQVRVNLRKGNTELPLPAAYPVEVHKAAGAYQP